MFPTAISRTTRRGRSRLGLICGLCLLARLSAATGFVDLNFYPELTEEKADSVFTLNAFARFSDRLHYFSLTNVINADRRTELSGDYTFYSEQNLRWALGRDAPWDLTFQANLRSGKDKERIRFGARWRLNDSTLWEGFFRSLHLSYSIDFHLLQLDHEAASVWQMEHVFRKTFPDVSDRLYLAGFVDHTFNEDLPETVPGSPIVAEVQLGYRLSGNWNLITEYRINQYRHASPANLALGVQYLHKW